MLSKSLLMLGLLAPASAFIGGRVPLAARSAAVRKAHVIKVGGRCMPPARVSTCPF